MTQASETPRGSAVLGGAVHERPVVQAPPTPWRRPAAPRPRYFLWFTPALGLLLGGYLFFDKPFAYLHVPGTPVFVGEIVLAIGIAEVLRIRSPWYHLLRSSPILKILLLFMALCVLRLAVDLPRYGIDAVRDSSIWYYGVFAFLVAAAAISEPTFVPRLLRWYRRVLPWYFLWAPIAVALTEVEALATVYVPGSSTPINSFRYTDFAVQVALGLGFLWLGIDRMVGARPERSRDTLVSAVGLIALLAVSSQTRGGFLAALVTLAAVLAFLPSGRRRRIALSGTAGLMVALTLVLMLDLRIQGDRRDVSVQQVVSNLSSLTGDQSSEDLSGTVEWRESFWQQVLDDLLSSRAWLTGLGFGQILPERYEVNPGSTNSETSAPLRSVHNSHLTILARVGLPGLGLWLLLWLTWAVHLFRWIRRRPGGIRDPATAAVVWLMTAIPAFLIGAYFDPSLEGPHVAVWLFTVVGLGVAATRVRRQVTVPAAMSASGRPPPAVPKAAPWPALLAHLRDLSGRLGWGVADLALSSLISLAVGFFVARSFGVRELGAFSIAFATYLTILAVFRGLATDGLSVRYHGDDPVSWRWATASAAGTAVVLGVAAGVVCAAAGLLLPGSTGAALLGLGFTLPGILLQDSWRSAFLATGKARQAFTNDMVWGLALVLVMAVMAKTGRASVGWAMLAWGGSATVAAAAGALQARLLPQLPDAVEWLRWHGDLAFSSFGKRLNLSEASQLRLYGLVAIAGLAAAGSLRAAELLLGPLNVLIMGIAMLALPEAADTLRRSSTRRLSLLSLLVGAVGAGGALLWGTAMLLLPDSLGVQILGSAWLPASQLLPAMTLALAGFGFSVGAWAGVQALGPTTRSQRAHGIGSAVYLGGALVGGALGGALGAAWGSAAGTLVGAGVWWWELHQAMREAEVATG